MNGLGANRLNPLRRTGLAAIMSFAGIWPVHAAPDKQITFYDIAADQSYGFGYRRTESPRDVIFDRLKAETPFPFTDSPLVPMKSRGLPGVAIFDYDGDGDEDLYVTNGPGTANSLYANQLMESGVMSFIDVSIQAGVDATDQDSAGVCYGDINNDGFEDIYVLGSGTPNRLFLNRGDGRFNDISESSGTAVTHFPSGCSMGDVNGDGLLDIAVANTWDNWDNRIPVSDPYLPLEHNQLFLNINGERFRDVSQQSGIQSLAGFPPQLDGAAGITWAISMVDYDQDGDVDIFMADDQGFTTPAVYGGVDRGLIHLMENDGTGHFTDVGVEKGIGRFGAWMGFAFGDVNGDKQLDVFVTNLGDYLFTLVPVGFTYELGSYATRTFLGQENGVFADPGVGDLGATFFGWGTAMLDYDNDGDTDIVYHGGQDVSVLIATNPGVVLNNNGSGEFEYDWHALSQSTDHSRRTVQGVASGDLNNDGFVDLVSVSNHDFPADAPLMGYQKRWGYDADTRAKIFPSFVPASNPGEFYWSMIEPLDGTLSVDINSADNQNNWVTIELTGTVGLTARGRTNRDGIGAVVTFTPQGGKPAMRPILGGASYTSQDSLKAYFGLGNARRGTVDILWPGGVRNRFYDLRASETVYLPEIPCSFDRDRGNARQYRRCVEQALEQMSAHEGLLKPGMKKRLMVSAMRAYREARHLRRFHRGERGAERPLEPGADQVPPSARS